MRKQKRGLTTAEWYLMECLWQHSPRSAREIVEFMQESQKWSRSTTLTVLRRMTEKEQIACDEQGEVRMYTPLVCREEALAEETDSFLNRAYQGSVSLMLSALTQRQELSQAEIDQLYEILRSAGREEER